MATRRWPAAFTGLVLIALVVCPLIADDSHVTFVPWKVIDPGADGGSSLFVLYWIPSSPEELRRSELVTSRALSLFAGRCVAMQVIRADDVKRLEKFAATGRLPVALIMDGQKELARADNTSGVLKASDVEAMVREAVDRREIALEGLLESARLRAASGDAGGAAELYKQICGQRCAFPRQARTAQRALKRLRVDR